MRLESLSNQAALPCALPLGFSSQEVNISFCLLVLRLVDYTEKVSDFASWLEVQ